MSSLAYYHKSQREQSTLGTPGPAALTAQPHVKLEQYTRVPGSSFSVPGKFSSVAPPGHTEIDEEGQKQLPE